MFEASSSSSLSPMLHSLSSRLVFPFLLLLLLLLFLPFVLFLLYRTILALLPSIPFSSLIPSLLFAFLPLHTTSFLPPSSPSSPTLPPSVLPSLSLPPSLPPFSSRSPRPLQPHRLGRRQRRVKCRHAVRRGGGGGGREGGRGSSSMEARRGGRG